MINEDSLQKRNVAMLPHLDERQRRLFAAAEAKAAGYGGIAAVSRVTRIAASTIGRGLKDIEALDSLAPGRVRRPGGGRKSLTETDPQLLDDLNALVEPDARGDPMSSRGSSPAAGNQQMEQDRAPTVLVHHPELARQTAGQLSRHRRFDRADDHAKRIKGFVRAPRQKLS
jgi:hypothetical protein